MADHRESLDLFRQEEAYAERFKSVNGHYPLILNRECYEHFGESCLIERVNLFDETHNAECWIRNQGGDLEKVDFSNLRWHHIHTGNVGEKYSEQERNDKADDLE